METKEKKENIKYEKEFCRRGAEMEPQHFEDTGFLDYHCPRVRIWNFLRHSANRGFIINK